MNTNIKRIAGIVAAVAATAAALSGCTNTGTSNDTRATDAQLQQYQKVQPIPFHDWSQYRQTQISIDDAQAHGTATTTFFFLMGIPNPIKVCSSIGYAVPSTTQLTSPDQYAGSGAVIAQMEPNGTYTGTSSGTYVVCIINGKPSPSYWEGEVETEPGAAHWDRAQGAIVNDGAPTVEVKTKK